MCSLSVEGSRFLRNNSWKNHKWSRTRHIRFRGSRFCCAWKFRDRQIHDCWIDTAWARVSRGVRQLVRQTGEFEPDFEGVEVVSVKEGTTVAPSQPEKSRLGTGRPFPACSQIPPPTPTDRLQSGQPEIARPCIKRPSASQLSASRSNKPLLTPGTPAVGSWYKKDNSDSPGIAVGERRWSVVGYSERYSHEPEMFSRRLSMEVSHREI